MVEKKKYGCSATLSLLSLSLSLSLYFRRLASILTLLGSAAKSGDQPLEAWHLRYFDERERGRVGEIIQVRFA